MINALGLQLPVLATMAMASERTTKGKERVRWAETGAAEAWEPGGVRLAQGQGRAEAQDLVMTLCVSIPWQAGWDVILKGSWQREWPTESKTWSTSPSEGPRAEKADQRPGSDTRRPVLLIMIYVTCLSHQLRFTQSSSDLSRSAALLRYSSKHQRPVTRIGADSNSPQPQWQPLYLGIPP